MSKKKISLIRLVYARICQEEEGGETMFYNGSKQNTLYFINFFFFCF